MLTPRLRTRKGRLKLNPLSWIDKGGMKIVPNFSSKVRTKQCRDKVRIGIPPLIDVGSRFDPKMLDYTIIEFERILKKRRVAELKKWVLLDRRRMDCDQGTDKDIWFYSDMRPRTDIERFYTLRLSHSEARKVKSTKKG